MKGWLAFIACLAWALFVFGVYYLGHREWCADECDQRDMVVRSASPQCVCEPVPEGAVVVEP